MEPKLVQAKIVAIRQETPRIKSFLLDVGGRPYRFLPGQWIDLYLDIGGQTEIGGYSPTSSPLQLSQMELAVRRAYRSPASHYLYEQARPGEIVVISEGQGKFSYRCAQNRSIVLIGGGIGLTPLMSMIRHASRACPENMVHLLYSIRDPSEYLYRQELTELATKWPQFKLWVTVTGANHDNWQGPFGRIDRNILRQQGLDSQALYYLCGPPSLTHSMTAALSAFGIPMDRIRFEAWSL